MAFPPGFLDEIRARVPVSEIVGRSVKLVKRGREHQGLCPFHNEKTPSFTVNDDKAFYHCFGCGAHGDAFKFLTEKHGLGFMEAVEQLANEAGLTMPERTQRDPEREEATRRLTDLMEDTAQWFQARLADDGGRQARAYVDTRQLKADIVKRFELGFAPEGRQRLRQAMVAKGWRDSELVEAGLAILPEDGGEPYDRFRGRLMFPIRDPRGRCIAFGGRALSPDAKAKYLNSPETPLFHKGRTLYNADKARKAAYDTGQLMVGEGYMDIIALSQAGFPAAVAPLGTALTEDQLTLLWRMVDEPILCFDGDKAGRRAAYRALERALPLLKAGKSLRFAMLPEGKDPDDILQSEGRGAMQGILDKAESLIATAWTMLVEEADLSTPERRAALKKQTYILTDQIADPDVRGFYQSEFKSRLSALFYPPRQQQTRAPRGSHGDGQRRAPWAPPRASRFLKSSVLARNDSEASGSEWFVRIALATVLNHPNLLSSHLETLANLKSMRKEVDAALESLLNVAPGLEGLDSQAQKDTLKQSLPTALAESLDRDIFVRSLSFTRPQAEEWQAEAGLTHTLAMLRRVTTLEEECSAARQAMGSGDGEVSQSALQRLNALQSELAAQNAELASFDRGLSGDEADI